MERVWPRVWQAACREQEIAEQGDYVNYEIGRESIIVLRSAPDAIRAFYNVCPHRGRRLLTEERGNVSAVFCAYHAWTFNLEGQPTSIPDRHDWNGCPQSSDSDLSLGKVRCDTWAGWVWICMDPDAPSLQDYLGAMPSRLDRYRWDECRIRSHQTIIFPVNWKVALEAFVEPYHVIATHPQLLRWGHGPASPTEEYLNADHIHAGHYGGRQYDWSAPDREFTDPREYIYTNNANIYHDLHGIVHEAGMRASERLRSAGTPDMTFAEASQLMGQLRREEIEKDGAIYPDEVTPQDQSILEWLLFPNSSVLTSVEGAFWYRVRPNGDDPESCIFQVIVLGRYAPGTVPEFEYEFYPDIASFKGKNPILEQDFSNVVAVHKGMQSRGFKGARPNPQQESQVSNFHRVLHRFIYGEADFA